MKEEEIEEGDCGPPNPKKYFFEILPDLNQAVPNHLADCLVQVRQNLKKKLVSFLGRSSSDRFGHKPSEWRVLVLTKQGAWRPVSSESFVACTFKWSVTVYTCCIDITIQSDVQTFIFIWVTRGYMQRSTWMWITIQFKILQQAFFVLLYWLVNLQQHVTFHRLFLLLVQIWHRKRNAVIEGQ